MMGLPMSYRPPFRPRKIIHQLIGVPVMAREKEHEIESRPAAPKAATEAASASAPKSDAKAEAKAREDANKPQESGFDPIASMVENEKARVEAEEKLATEMDELAKAAAEDDREPVAYTVLHSVVGGHSRGSTVTAEQLVPVPKDSKPEDSEKLRKEGLKRLMDLGAVSPIYEEK
jgi:hypothetical protein